ncbi:unnamed protein product, partial [Rotaria sp. Silwood2]
MHVHSTVYGMIEALNRVDLFRHRKIYIGLG